jgi:hypothetical protein
MAALGQEENHTKIFVSGPRENTNRDDENDEGY